MTCYQSVSILGRLLVISTTLAASDLQAAVTLSFSNGDSFDGDAAGDSAGPFLDPDTGVGFTIETVGIGGGSAINTTSGRLGIVGGSGSGANSRFNQDESWTFNFGGTGIDLLGFDFGLFTGAESYRLESTAWAGEAYDAPGAAISFSSTASSGFFTFFDNGSSDIFTSTDFTSSGVVSIDSGNDLVLSYAGSDVNGSVLEGFTVQANPSAVPEPSTLVLGAVATPLVGFVHWRRRRKARSPGGFSDGSRG